jgi:hypothetical protein
VVEETPSPSSPVESSRKICASRLHQRDRTAPRAPFENLRRHAQTHHVRPTPRDSDGSELAVTVLNEGGVHSIHERGRDTPMIERVLHEEPFGAVVSVPHVNPLGTTRHRPSLHTGRACAERSCLNLHRQRFRA